MSASTGLFQGEGGTVFEMDLPLSREMQRQFDAGRLTRVDDPEPAQATLVENPPPPVPQDPPADPLTPNDPPATVEPVKDDSAVKDPDTDTPPELQAFLNAPLSPPATPPAAKPAKGKKND